MKARKHLIAVILVLAMVLSMIPSMALQINAVEYLSSNAEVLEIPDFTVEIPTGRDMVVLHLTDTQIIDASQKRDPDRLSAGNNAYWAKDMIEERCYDYVTETVKKTNPDLILITGDLVYGEFDDSGEAFTDFVRFMDSFGIPWAPIFGNHDNESTMGVDWQCQQLENATYCLFEQKTLTGNGNYSVGVVQGGELLRVFYMLDSNGCSLASDESLANGHTKTTVGFGDDQIAWYTDQIQQIKALSPDTKFSMAFHIQPEIFRIALSQYGTVDANTINAPINIDCHENKADTDFGYIGRNLKGAWDNDYTIFNGMKTLGVDSIFVGHEHCNSASVMLDGVRFQYGQKSSTYDRANYVDVGTGQIIGSYGPVGTPLIGGTVVPISSDGSLLQPYIYFCENAGGNIDWDQWDQTSGLPGDDEAGVMNFKNFTLKTQGAPTVTIGNEGSTVSASLSSGSINEMIMTATNTQIDHSKDMILTQYIDPTNLSVQGTPRFGDYNAWLDSSNVMRNAYNFWISDTADSSEGAAVVFSVGKLYVDGNKDGSKMMLRVHHNGNNLNTDIALKAYSTDSFELSVRWNADDSVDVYVDGVLKGTVENATVNTTTLFGDNTVGIRYYTHNANGAPGEFSISNMSLKTVDPSVMNFNDFACKTQGASTVTIENEGGTVSASLSSGSINEMVMTAANTQIDHSKDMILTQYIDPTNLSVQGTPRFADYNAWVDSSNVMRNAYNFWISDTADSSEGAAVVFSVGKLYVDGNKDGSKMMLRVHHNGNNVNTDIALKAYSTDPFELSVCWNADDSVDVYVDGTLVGTVANATINTTALFGDNTVGIRYYTHNANGAPGEFSISNMSLKTVDPSVMNFNDFALSTQGAPVVSVEDAGNTVRADLSGGSIKGMIMTTTDTQVDHSKDMILTQKINPINLSANGNPVFGDYNTWNETPNDVRNAYDFWIGETAHASEGAAVAFSVGALFNNSINKDGSKMILRVHQNGSKVFTDVILKDYDTTPFELSVCWNADDSVDIYVDGVLKGTVENATINTTTIFGDNTVGIHYYTNNGNGVKGQFAVSNMTLTAVEPEVPAESVASVGGEEYTSFADAYAAAGAEDVIVLLDEIAVEDWTLSKDVTIDLNGFAMEAAVAAVENNAVIYGMDSTTDSYDAEVCGSLKVTGATVIGAESYLALTDGENQYSFHAYQVKLTHVSLDPNADALGYKAQVFGDSRVQAAVTGYGFIMQAGGGQSKTYQKTEAPVDGVFTLRLKGILAANGGETQIGAEAFVIFSDVGEVKSGNHSTTMKETLETIESYVENDAATYTETQMTAIQNLIAEFESKMDGWDIDSIKNWTAA